ncbi:MAG: aldehyde dehydrogenase [Candidatus Sedimenticola endophacoides]|uniref:Aldehyde dehydrogenase n=1 Tax=Candidatus Sedimenticola endophacoides TaxID=2548426 RepID=A0A6N4DQM7_9GAMM|nr:MAG: aldehyde dehydrogenase [Candidatus Sedimenticola endophacoides]OQX34965.1 MAG: aldehyde dehydrogenase [Candidatus Sedimenticola endophacoides]PUE00659.1 MAG: aldehyde dehydrogenase [Candidatus Sedimenticola endophacoides]PUE02095.1 MAG: aldehyde dehydrogenase [Candidatus Sedimenticola endophacoides]PUE05087.1 MAG: aldehyde dehydrogenase [Candidatus Sedimenticola endophacoides]
MSASAHFPHLIAGEVRPVGRLDVVSPFDQSPIASVDLVDEAGVEVALRAADALFRDRDRWLAPWRRVEILERARDIMRERAEELALEAAREGGKPLIDSRVEVARAIDGVRLCIEALRTGAGDEIPMGLTEASVGRLAFTRREPIGVVVALSAFNHPLNLIVHQLGPAVAAGCPAIVKPAPDAPLSCMRFVQILHQAGLPLAWAQALVTRDNETAARLAGDRRVGFLSFIGSAEVGWQLRSRLAPGARCALEHGGVAPVIVEADADLDDAIPLMAKGGFYHGGQVCVSVQRIFAHARIARDLAQGLCREAGRMRVGDPTSEATAVGPLIRPGEVARVHQWVGEAVAGGAELLCGGHPVGETCYAPTVLFNPPEEARVSTREVFGPVVCVYPFERAEQAIERANALPYAFQAAVFTKHVDRALRAYRRLDASAVMVNDFTAFRVDWMPFAGLRHSGLGVGGIGHTFRDMQIEKMLVLRSPEL